MCDCQSLEILWLVAMQPEIKIPVSIVTYGMFGVKKHVKVSLLFLMGELELIPIYLLL